MNDSKAEWKSVFAKAIEKFFDFMKVLVTCATVLAAMGIVAFVVLRYKSPFAQQESRLAHQLEVVLTEAPGTLSGKLDAEQRLELAKSLVEKYDPATDSLTPQLDPDYKPLTLDEIFGQAQVPEGDRGQMKEAATAKKAKEEW